MNMFDLRERGEGAPDVVRKPNAPEQTGMDMGAHNIKIFGAVFNTYVLVEYGEKFHIIDQHAAQERILFDRLCAQIDGGRVEKQRLLSPEIIMVSPQDALKVEQSLGVLNACGIECEPFGHNTFRITAVPVIVANHGVGAMLDTILGDVRVTKLSDVLRDKIVTQCCKASVKAGQALSANELGALVRDIMDKKVTPTCPHGRPIIKSFSKYEIEKMFARK
jgi:DNA mismatch repair protein MutL